MTRLLYKVNLLEDVGLHMDCSDTLWSASHVLSNKRRLTTIVVKTIVTVLLIPSLTMAVTNT